MNSIQVYINRIALVFLILFLLACGKDQKETTHTKNNSSSEPAADASAEVDVSLIDANGIQSLLEENRGKVLFINTWATWCVPCKEEFPDLVKLKEFYRESDVAFIGISVDLPDQIEGAVKPFLRSQKVNFPNYVQNFKDPADLINLLNKEWRGAVPATFIYDKAGQQQAYLLGKHSFDEFRSEIERIREMN